MTYDFMLFSYSSNFKGSLKGTFRCEQRGVCTTLDIILIPEGENRTKNTLCLLNILDDSQTTVTILHLSAI